MNKLLAIIRHEYWKRVRSLGFILTTVLGPLVLAATFIIPVLIAFIQPSAPKVAVLDQTGELFQPLRAAIEEHKGWALEHPGRKRRNEIQNTQGSQATRLPMGEVAYFKLEEVKAVGRPIDEMKRELTASVLSGRLDAYLIIPIEALTSGRVEYYSRSSGDPITDEQFDDYLRRAIVERRMAKAGITSAQLSEMTASVKTNRVRLTERGGERTSGTAFFQVMGVGMLLLISLISYSGAMLSAVTQEKENRLAEILFSSVRSFTLLLGKLIGVSLVALTQYAIWIGAVGLFALYRASTLGFSDMKVELLELPVSFFIYLVAFFLIGYFIFATMYTVVGALLTDQNDNSALALFITVPLVIAFSMSMPVMRSPNSWMAIVASFIPVLSPILMPIRIIAQTPPTWQILLSLFIGVVSVLVLLRLAATVYHTGMLMYGKKVTLPEVIRWARH